MDIHETLSSSTETLNTFAHYFKSLEYRRLEASTEEIKKSRSQKRSKPGSQEKRTQEEKREP